MECYFKHTYSSTLLFPGSDSGFQLFVVLEFIEADGEIEPESKEVSGSISVLSLLRISLPMRGLAQWSLSVLSNPQ